MNKICRQTSVQALKWIKNASTGAITELNRDRQWAARIISDLEDTPVSQGPASYQAEMSLDQDWQIQVFIEEGFDVRDMEDFISWCDDPSTDWSDCPILYEREAAEREVPYVANGVVVGPSDVTPDNKHVTIQSPVPVPSEPEEWITELKNDNEAKETPRSVVCSFISNRSRLTDNMATKRSKKNVKREEKKAASVRPSDVNNSDQTYPCRRNSKTEKGWYAGLEPCSARVNKENKYCADCHAIFLNKQSKAN
jgi:hypothetical protein